MLSSLLRFGVFLHFFFPFFCEWWELVGISFQSEEPAAWARHKDLQLVPFA